MPAWTSRSTTAPVVARSTASASGSPAAFHPPSACWAARTVSTVPSGNATPAATRAMASSTRASKAMPSSANQSPAVPVRSPSGPSSPTSRPTGSATRVMSRAVTCGSSTRRAMLRAASRGVRPSSLTSDSTRSSAARLLQLGSVWADSARARMASGVPPPGMNPSKPPSGRCWRASQAHGVGHRLVGGRRALVGGCGEGRDRREAQGQQPHGGRGEHSADHRVPSAGPAPNGGHRPWSATTTDCRLVTTMRRGRRIPAGRAGR